MVENVFADVPSEGATLDIDKAFERLETKEDKTSSDSQPLKKETDKPSQEGVKTPVKEEIVPFHKHPRWIQQQKDLKETREKIAKLESEKTSSKSVQVPDWWIKQYGDTPESKARYEAVVQKDGELDWIKNQIKEDLKQETQAETQSIKAGEEYVTTQLGEMKDEGMKFERNTLLKFMVEFQEEFGPRALLDSDNNYDFRKALTLMEKMQPEKVDASSVVRKQVASLGGRGKAASTTSSDVPVLSRNALRRGNWRDADK